jgi:hypothetical protein
MGASTEGCGREESSGRSIQANSTVLQISIETLSLKLN